MTNQQITGVPQPPVTACCDPSAQQTCCEPSEKAACCGQNPQSATCGCK